VSTILAQPNDTLLVAHLQISPGVSNESMHTVSFLIEAEFKAEETQRHVCPEDLENEDDTHAVSESENESTYTDDSFVERDEVSEDGDFDPNASTQAISASETSSNEDSECESIDDAATECESIDDAASECESIDDAAADSVRQQEQTSSAEHLCHRAFKRPKEGLPRGRA
jgi:hypothetical protein